MAFVTKPVTNPILAQAIVAARQDSTEENWARVVRAALDARFITPLDVQPPRAAAGGETTFSFHMLEDSSDRKRYYLAFTDWDELTKWRRAKGQRALILSFEDYAQLVLDGRIEMGGFVINPYGGNIVFNKAMLEAVRNKKEVRADWGSALCLVEKGTTVCLGQPSEYPEGLVGALTAYLMAQPNVRAAYLQLLEKGGALSYLVALDFAGEAKPLFDGIGGAAANSLGDMNLDLVSCDSSFWRETGQDIEPFYRRESAAGAPSPAVC